MNCMLLQKGTGRMENYRRKACVALSVALLAGMTVPAVPACAASSGSQTFTADGSAKVAVTAVVPERVTADYTVVLPTSVSLEYDTAAGSYTGTLNAGVYGTIDESSIVYTKITSDPDSPVDKDASGSYIDGVMPDGSQDAPGKITRWYKLTETGGSGTGYLTAVQSTDSGHVMGWIDAAVSGGAAEGEAVMASDSDSVEFRPISVLNTELADSGSYSGNVMVEFGVADR